MSTKENQLAVSMQVPDTRGVAAFPGLVVAGEMDDLLSQALEITMTEDWMGYLNARVMTEVFKYYTGRPVFFRFLPDPVASMVIILQAKDANEYGATEIKYSETENGAWVNLRLPLKQLQVAKQAKRVRIFPVVTRQGADGKTYLAFTVKDSATRPVQTRPKKGAQNPQPQGDQAQKQPETAADSQGATK